MEACANQERFRKYAPELNLLLWAIWDPIGAGVPIDEYGNSVPVIWRLLEEHAGMDAVTAGLQRICDERLGGGRGTEREAAERLTAWWYWRFDFPEEFEANS